MPEQKNHPLPRSVGLAISLGISALCIGALVITLKNVTYASLGAALGSVGAETLIVATALVVLNFIVTWGMELCALRDAGVSLSPWRAAGSAFIGNALSIAAGLGPISGSGVRAVLFQKWRVSATSAVATAVSTTLMSLTGGAVLALLGFIIQPEEGFLAGAPVLLVRAGSGGALLVMLTAISLAVRRRMVCSLMQAQLSAPSAFGACARVGLGALDWVLSANVLYVLLGTGLGAAPWPFVSNFAAAHFAAMAAGSPAGLGVFDLLMLKGGALGEESARVMVALLLYRLVAMAVPATLALICFLVITRTHYMKRRHDAVPNES